VCLGLFVILTSAFGQLQGVIAISGKVYAPVGQDIAGTIVVACFVAGSDCDESKTKTFEILESGNSASFTLDGLTRDQYLLFASKDTNANNIDFDDGDFYALYGADGNVTPPARNVELKLEILGAASSENTDPNQNTDAVSSATGLEPYTVSGIVLDTKGQPLEGAIIRLRQDFISGRTEVTSGPDGRYKASSSVQNASASYKIDAFIEVPYDGQAICQRLGMPNPNDYNSFTLDQGAERNFQWQLSGQIGSYETFLGATLSIWSASEFADTSKAIELTLTPTGPMLDGSEGSVIVQEVPPGNMEDASLYDIPVGPYTLRATLIGHDGSRSPINITADTYDPYIPELALEWQSTNDCGFRSDSGVEQIIIFLDEDHPMSIKSQTTGFGE
jgi:hypothetical protein